MKFRSARPMRVGTSPRLDRPPSPDKLGSSGRSAGFSDAYGRSARTTNAIERLHEEFKRRIKTQTVVRGNHNPAIAATTERLAAAPVATAKAPALF
jgi:hypothetical protein